MSVFSEVFTNHKLICYADVRIVDVQLRRSLMTAEVGAQCNLVNICKSIQMVYKCRS